MEDTNTDTDQPALEEPLEEQIQLAFFIGTHLRQHLMLAKIIPKLLYPKYRLYIFLVADNEAADTDELPFALQRLKFYERDLFQDHVIHFQGQQVHEGAVYMTVEQMHFEHGIHVENVANLNCQEFLSKIKDHQIDLAISLGCQQKFGSKFLEYFAFPHALAQVQLGLSDSYIGFFGALRAMLKNEKEFGICLRHFSTVPGSAKIVERRSRPLNYEKSVFCNTEMLNESGAELVLKAIDRFVEVGHVRFSDDKVCTGVQDDTKNNEDTEDSNDTADTPTSDMPTDLELEECKQRGLNLVNSAPIKCLLVKFAGTDPDQKRAFMRKIEDAIEWFFRTRDPEGDDYRRYVTTYRSW